VLRTAGETEIKQENIQDGLQLDEGDPGFKLFKEKEIAEVIFFNLFLSALLTLLNYPFMCFISFCLLELYFLH
jgi:hypothetical protein